MGEVSRTSADRSNLKYNDKTDILTFKKVFNIQPALIHSRNDTNVGTKKKTEVMVSENKIEQLTDKEKKYENNSYADVKSTICCFHNEDGQPLSKNTPNVRQVTLAYI